MSILQPALPALPKVAHVAIRMTALTTLRYQLVALNPGTVATKLAQDSISI